MRLEIYNPLGELKRIVSTAPSSQWSRELMGDDMVSASWTDTECIPLQVDDHIRLQGQTYSIQQEYHPTKKHDGEYVYRVNFYAPLHLASRVMYLNLTDGQYNPEFSLDDSPRAHLQKWVDNMRRRPGEEPWSIGTVIDAPNKNIVYNKVDCLQAGRLMAEAFETELWADGHTINLCPCERGERVNLGYRQGLTSLTRTEGSRRTKFFTRLIPLGSTRNIQATAYGAKRLQLPHGRKYVERNTHLGLIEHVEETAFAHIYPRYVGTVSGVRTQQRRSPEGREYTVYHFSDSGLGFNPSEHKVPGLTMQVSFVSGELNGRDFEVEYSPARGEWEIINTYPDEQTQLPGGNLIPKAGDRYIPYNLRMPEVYITRAEQELEAAVQDYLGRYSQDISIYEGQTDYIHIRRQGVPLQPGQRVHLVSPEYFGEHGYDTRITRVVSKLDELSDATISCSSQVGRGWRSGLESSVNTLEYVLARQREDTQVDVLRMGDEREVTDHHLLSALRTLREIQRRALSRLQPDTAGGHITFADGLTSAKMVRLLEGLITADYVGGLTGRGAKIDKDGHAELDSLFVRKFIESSELRYNRVSVIQGEQWHAKGVGIIQSVDTEAKRLHLKLEAGELPTVAVGDLCKANYNTGTGFTTVYFKVISVTPEGVVSYELRPGYNAHPTPTMHFVAFGNTTDATRQQSAYSTTGYTRYLRGVNDWEIGLGNIAMQLGDLSNLSVYGLQLEGYSAYLNNVYFTGLIAQIGQAVADKLPRIDPATGTWLQWDEQAGRMVDSGIKAKGEDGRDGTGDGVAKMLYDDPTFAKGRNNTYVYGSNDPNLLRLERVPTADGNPYPSTHMMRITSNGQCPRGWGGFYFGAPTKANQILIARFVAKIPQGRSITFVTNPLGDNNSHRWLTPNQGTGKWEEYVYYVFAGTSGSFGATMFFYLTGGDTPTPANPLVWHIAYATVYDATSVMAATTDLASAMSIERYINLVETERAAMEATYAKVYALPLLSGTPKTTLLNANTTYKGAADNLLASVRTAIAGGRTTPAQKADVDAKYNVYKSALISLRIALEEGERAAADAATQISLDLAKYSGGKMMYTDPTFADGDNGVRPYNNAANGLLRIERVAAEQGCPTSSTHMLRVSVTGSTTPGWGGIYFGVVPKHNHVYIIRLLAKVPVGRTLRNPGTRVGSGGSHEWLTTQDGTGRWQEYIYKLTMGDSGVLDSSFYVFLMGGATPSADAPLVWQIASATVYDATDMEAAADAVAEAKAIERYINPVETERAAMEASYAKVYANPLLVGPPKTLLLNANTTYKGAADNLLAAVRTAIAGGRTTPAQKADVDGKYNAYKSALISLRVALEEGERAATHVAMGKAEDLAKYNGKGRMLYTDPMFDQGLNDLYVYPGTDVNQGVTTLERVPNGEGNPYPSTHMVKVTCRGRLIRDWGGFHFARWGTPTKANQILITRIVAKIPTGRRMVFASNSLGDNNAHRWLTSSEGTGKWEEYVYYVFAGTGGRFNSTNYFYLTGGDTPTADNPLIWYVAFATVYDATSVGPDYLAEIAAKTGELKSYVDGAFADGMIGSAEAKAIERYINVVETERAAMEATYTKVYTNPLLVGQPKTTLLNTKVGWEGKVTALLSAIRTAIADGKTTAAEKADVDAKYGAYKTDTAALNAALQDAGKAIDGAATKAAVEMAKYANKGKMLYPDPTFRLGTNGLYHYNNAHNGMLRIERIPTGQGNPYPSTHMLRITTTGQASPGWGGFYFDTPTKANQVLIARIVAKIPVGRSIAFATNTLGSDTTHGWITSNKGTGRWEDYIYRVEVGSLAPFNTTNYFYLTGGDTPTAGNPLIWYVAYAGVFDPAEVEPAQPTYLPPTVHDPSLSYVGGDQYAAVVYDTNNLWYKALKDVPAGTPLSNRTYWQPISSMGAVGMQEAYVRSLWANQAFIDRLHAESITAQSIKAGVNPHAPQGYNALINEQGYGHLLGGALIFDAGGLHLGAFDVDNGRVTIKDEAGKDRVIYSNDATPELSVVSASSTFTGPIQERTLTDANISFVLRGTSAEALPSDYPFRFVGDGRTPWRHWRGTGEHSSLLHSGARPDTTLDFSLQLSMTVLQGEMYGCIAEVYLINPVLGHRKVATWTYAGNSTHTQRIQVPNMPQGGYQIRVVYDMGVRNVYDEPPVVSCRVKVLPGGSAYSNPKGYRCIAYHNNGWFIAYPDLLMYMSETEGLHLTGNTNLPGVLCAARVSADKTVQYKWGKFVNEVKDGVLLPDPGIHRANDGTYTVYHSIGHTNYVPTVTPQNSGGAMVDMIGVYPYSFTFKMYNRHGAAITSAFNFQCVGSNG